MADNLAEQLVYMKAVYWVDSLDCLKAAQLVDYSEVLMVDNLVVMMVVMMAVMMVDMMDDHSAETWVHS